MKKKRYILMTNLAAAVLLAFSACSQDEIVGGDDCLLPDGAYPLKIGNVNIVAQSSEEQWNSSQQTRVTEDQTNGNNSVWQRNETIGVRMSYDPIYDVPTTEGQYTISVNENKFSATAVQGKEVYWRSAYNDGTVLAWYPAENGSLNLSDQSNGLTYALKGSGSGNFAHDGTTVNLTFTHQLAKVRVALEGERVSQVTKVEVFGYTSCTNTQGTVTTDGASQGWISMHKATYTDGNTYWEANLVPGAIKNDYIRLNGTTVVPLSGLTELVAGKLHTVTITVRAQTSN